MRVELLWFLDCPNHVRAETMLREAMAEVGAIVPVVRIEVPDEATGNAVCFPGSPTIRIDGRDVEPGWEPCADCTPRCRLYMTTEGLVGVPPRDWIAAALRAARSN